MKLYLIVSFVCLFLHVDFPQNELCAEILQVRGQINSGDFKATATLNSKASILANSDVVFESGNVICLESKFSTEENRNFLYTIEACDNNKLVMENALAWSSFPTSVSAGSTHTIELAYSLLQQGVIHLILADENWNKIGEASINNLMAQT